MKTTTSDRILSALLAIPLLCATVVEGVPVTRASLLGYRVGSEVLEASEAAERLATLVWRVRGALAQAAARLKARGVKGAYSVKVGGTPSGRPEIVVKAKVGSEVDCATSDEREALALAAIVCKEAGLWACVIGRVLCVIG